MLILFSHRHDEAEVGIDELVFGFLAFRTSFANGLCQFYFLFWGDHFHTADFNKIFVEGLF